jgi:hypothetical protein
MRKEYDFAKGERRKFHHPDAELNIPIYLETKIARAVHEQARKRRTSMTAFVNEVLRKSLRMERETPQEES